MVYLHSFLLNYFPKRAARKKQFLMSVLTEQKLTKFQELPVSPPPPSLSMLCGYCCFRSILCGNNYLAPQI